MDGRRSPAGELRCRAVPALADRLAPLRRTLREWAEAAGLRGERVDDLLLASHEAMANVVDHAYRRQPGTFDLSARTEQGRVVVTVTDHGRWRPAAVPTPESLRGRGLKLINELADTVTVLPGDAGTRVEMSWLL